MKGYEDNFVSNSTAAMLAQVGFVSDTTPTQTAAAKWLRYEQDISVEPVSTRTRGRDRTYRVFVNSNVTLDGGDFDSYEDALEYGIMTACRMLQYTLSETRTTE